MEAATQQVKTENNIARAVSLYRVAAQDAEMARLAIIAAFEALPNEQRVLAVMNFYWTGPRHILRPEEIRRLAFAESEADFRLKAKTFQPTSVEDCLNCHRPMIVKFYRNGRATRDICKECASVRDAEITKARHEACVEQQVEQRERESEAKSEMRLVIRQLLQSAGPKTKTAIRKRFEVSSRHGALRNSNWAWYFDGVFDMMVEEKILVMHGMTANHRTIWKLEEQFFHQVA